MVFWCLLAISQTGFRSCADTPSLSALIGSGLSPGLPSLAKNTSRSAHLFSVVWGKKINSRAVKWGEKEITIANLSLDQTVHFSVVMIHKSLLVHFIKTKWRDVMLSGFPCLYLYCSVVVLQPAWFSLLTTCYDSLLVHGYAQFSQ